MLLSAALRLNINQPLPAYETIHTVEKQQVRTRRGEQVTIRVGDEPVGIVPLEDKDMLKQKLAEELALLRDHLAIEGGAA